VRRKRSETNKRTSTPTGSPENSPEDALGSIIPAVVDASRKAQKCRQSLAGSGFYASKFAELHAETAIQLRRLRGNPANDVSRLEALCASLFDTAISHSERVNRSRELSHELKLQSWSSGARADAEDGLFPLCILRQAGRGYLVSVGTQMNGSYQSGWCDASAVMMRRLLETVIIEAFEANHLESRIKDGGGDFFQLTDLVNTALEEPSWNLTRGTKRALPKLKDIGHQSAHSRRYNARKPELDKLAPDVRLVIEEFLHLANLLN
jgi:hypothetical protein